LKEQNIFSLYAIVVQNFEHRLLFILFIEQLWTD